MSWYDLIDKGLAASGLEDAGDRDAVGKVKRYSPAGRMRAAPPARRRDSRRRADRVAGLAADAAPPEAPRTSLLRPSEPAEDEGQRSATGESSQLRARALQRGTLVHRLLQSLPDIAAERRREAARRLLARNADGWTESRPRSAGRQVLGLIADPRFAAVFAPGSRAEVSIAGRLDRRDGRRRWCRARSTGWWCAGRGPDRRLQDQPRAASDWPPRRPQGYVRQLALYRAVLASSIPRPPRRAALDRSA